ncbi:hypothetical protein [Kytococcus sedentarius]|uniref:hypothetical protein n=1 Tax=Kytococcus sedentarius TaxID=1276 RepID=UPI0035BC6113
MRTTRTLALITTGLVAAGTLSACGGGPDALDQAGTKEVLLSSEDFPLDGYEQGTVKEGSDNDENIDTEGLKNSFSAFGELNEECKTAMDEMSELKPSDYLEAQSSADYTGGENKTVSLMVGGTKEDAQKLIDAFKKLGAECDELKQEQQGVEISVKFDEVDEDNFAGSTITMEAAGEKQELAMGGKTVGDNLVMVMTQGASVDDAQKVVEAQAKAIEDK